MSKHTSDGPWGTAGLTGPNPRILGGPLHLVKCEGVVIAFIPAWMDDEHEEAKANARLIAAAPDLLNAANALLFVVKALAKELELDAKTTEFRFSADGKPLVNVSLARTYEVAEAAIAKATGESA